MKLRDLIFVTVITGLGFALYRSAFSPPPHSLASKKQPSANALAWRDGVRPMAAKVDGVLKTWPAGRVAAPVPRASDLALMRRLSLALTGTIPSLEEIRWFESLSHEDRVDAWLDALLRDRRSADYLAERFARAFVGTEDGPFIVFRRRRFAAWLSDAILANRPYDAVVRDLIADQGLWTDHPATNFISVTQSEETERPDPERLAARVSRGFLGIRLDCAQCHDHPFESWKQDDFRSLAAFFGGVYSSLRGIRDGETQYHPLDRSKDALTIEPRVPFAPELLPSAGNPRQRLAAWITDPANPKLAQATVNRVWALMLGRPLVDPIDDLPADGELPPPLVELARDFTAQGFDLHRLIRIIASTDLFRLESVDVAPIEGDDAQETWASFPMTRLRPDQVAGAIFQAASHSTLGPQSPWLVRLATFTGRNDFVRRYGDTGEDEFAHTSGTIPQRLVMMNGDVVEEQTKEGLFSASTRIAEMAPDDRSAVELAYLTVLTRRPTEDERIHFERRIVGTAKSDRKNALTDLFWTLLNSTEFSWNH